MNTRTMASATSVASSGARQDAGVARDVFVPGYAAERETEVYTGLKAAPFGDANRLEADVVRFFQNRNGAAAVEGDVELAGQAVQRTVVEDVVMPLASVSARVQQLARTDAGGRTAGDVADIVGAGAAPGQAERR